MNRFVAVVLLGVAFPVIGDTTLRFDECAVLAGQHNADLRNAESNLAAAQYRAHAAASGYLPQVTGSIGYSDSAGAGIDSGTTYSTGVTATQNLFSGFQDQAKVAQAEARTESARAALVLAKAQLSSDLKNSYAGLLYAQNNVTLTRDIQRRLGENLRLVELRFESGRENKGSYLLTRASLSQGRLENLQARQALMSSRAQLARVLGQPASGLTVTDSVPLTEPVTTPPDFEALVKATPGVRDVVAKEQSAQADVQLARAGFYPSVNLSGTVSREGQSWYPDGNHRSVGASISIPLFSGGRDYNDTRAALAALDAAEAARASLERQTLVALQRAFYTYVESVERLTVDRDFLDAGQTRAQIARAQYENGLLSFSDWNNIENELIQRQKSILASLRDRVAAEAAWDLVNGKGMIP